MCAKKIKEKKDVKETYSQLARSYYSDLTANDMLYAKIIRSTISKGTLKSISLDEIPEGYYFFTAADFGEQNYVETLDIQTEIFASNEVCYKGQPLGIIAGPDVKELKRLLTFLLLRALGQPFAFVRQKVLLVFCLLNLLWIVC